MGEGELHPGRTCCFQTLFRTFEFNNQAAAEGSYARRATTTQSELYSKKSFRGVWGDTPQPPEASPTPEEFTRAPAAPDVKFVRTLRYKGLFLI